MDIRALASDPEGWRTPGRCDSAYCAEVKMTEDLVLIRATWNRERTAILTRSEWEVLVKSIKDGEYD